MRNEEWRQVGSKRGLRGLRKLRQLKPFIPSSTCQLVNLSTRQLVNSSTCQLLSTASKGGVKIMAVKKSTWDLIIKIICAVAGVLAGALDLL